MSSTNRGGERRLNDDYQTPPSAVEALLRHVTPHGYFLEPCLGSGNITRTVGRLCPRVNVFDHYELTEGRDFLDDSKPAPRCDWIITNPPYSLAREFIEKSISLAPNVAMLLRLNFLGSKKRAEWWQPRRPTALYVVTPRPCFLDREGNKVRGQSKRTGTDSCEYAWFVWSRLYQGIHVIGEGQ